MKGNNPMRQIDGDFTHELLKKNIHFHTGNLLSYLRNSTFVISMATKGRHLYLHLGRQHQLFCQFQGSLELSLWENPHPWTACFHHTR